MEVNILFVFFKINFYNLNIMRFVENLEKLRQLDLFYDKNCQGIISWMNLLLKKKQYQNIVWFN